MPQLLQLRRNPTLTNISKKFVNFDYVNDQVFPALPVVEDAGFYYLYDQTELRNVDSRMGPDTKARTPEIDYNLTRVPYGPLEKRKLMNFINEDELRLSKPPLNAEIDATQVVTNAFLLNKEVNAANVMQDTTKITQNTTNSGTSQWSDPANSTPFDDIRVGRQTIKAAGVKLPNTAIMSWEVWAVLQNHPDFLDRIKFSGLGYLTPELFAQLIEVDKVIIAKAAQNTAKEGQTSSITPVWGKHFWLGFINPEPQLKSISMGYTLQINDARGVDNWMSKDPAGEYVRISDYYLQYLMAPEVAYGIFNAVA